MLNPESFLQLISRAGDGDKIITKYGNFRLLGYVSNTSTNYTYNYMLVWFCILF